MQSLFDDYETETSASAIDGTSTAAQQGDVSVTATGAGSGQRGSQRQQQAGQRGPQGLDATAAVTGQNPVEAFVAATQYSREDLQLMLSAASLVLWILTTVYLSKEM